MTLLLGLDPLLVGESVDEMSDDRRLADAFAAEEGDAELGLRRRRLSRLLGHQHHRKGESGGKKDASGVEERFWCQTTLPVSNDASYASGASDASGL